MIYLYVKTHNKTGLKYLGKTIQDPYKYPGSGKRWKRHIKKHGKDLTTEILLTTESKEELKETGLFFSKLWNVVESNEWANCKPEEGDGGDTWTNNPNKELTSEKIRKANLGRKWTTSQLEKFINTKRNKDYSYSGNDTKDHRTFIGKTHSEKSKVLNSLNNRKEDAKKRQVRTDFKMNDVFREKCVLANLGKPKTTEHKKKLSVAQTGKMPGNVKIVLIGDQEYIGLQRAADSLQIPVSTLRNRIKSKNIHYSHIRYK
jgi:hypothetical protein